MTSVRPRRRTLSILLAAGAVCGLVVAPAAPGAGYPQYTSGPLVEAGPSGHLLAVHAFKGGLGSSFASPGAPFSTPVGQPPIAGAIHALALDGSGAATLLASEASGVLAARVAAPGAPFSAPVTLARSLDEGSSILAVDGSGAAVVAWRQDERVRVAVRPPGGSFAAARDLGPARSVDGAAISPAGAARVLVTRGVDPAPGTAATLLTLETDGAVRTDVLAQEAEGGALAQGEGGRILAVIRGAERPLGSVLVEPDGRRGPVISVAGRGTGFARVLGAALEPGGGAVVAWTYPADRTPATVHVAEGDAVAGYGPARRLDRPGRVAQGSSAFFASNRRGDAVVTWSAAVSRPRASFRPAGGRFGRPRVLSAGAGTTPTATVLPEGQAVLGWTEAGPSGPRQVVRRMSAAGLRPSRLLALLPRREPNVAPRRRARCRAARRGVIARTRFAVYRRSGRAGEREVCSLDTGHTQSFADGAYGDFLDTVRLAGRLVAWGTVSGEDVGTSPDAYAAVFVRDTRTGHQIGPLGIDELSSTAVIGDLVLARDGAVAVITCRAVRDIYDVDRPTQVARRRCSQPGGPATVVVADGLGGEARVVDRGRSIDPSSLELRGRRLTWRHGGRRRAVELRRIRLPD